MTRFFLIAFAITFAIYYTQAAPLSEDESTSSNQYEGVCDELKNIFKKLPKINQVFGAYMDISTGRIQDLEKIMIEMKKEHGIYNYITDPLSVEINKFTNLIQNKNATFWERAMKNEQDLQNAMNVFKSKTKKLKVYDAVLTADESSIADKYDLDISDCEEVQLFIPIIKNCDADHEYLKSFVDDLLKFKSKTEEIISPTFKLH